MRKVVPRQTFDRTIGSGSEVCLPSGSVESVSREKERIQMVQDQLIKRGIKDSRVLTAMERVPRHRFVSTALARSAYHDGPLSIGEGQTISQPYMVALMTEELSLQGDETVLEIGTGSGYQTAVLAELAKTVYTVERIPSLSERAHMVLEDLGYKNVLFKVGDGTRGWPEKAPFEGIIVTAGAPSIVESLVDQLNEGGKLVIPVGSRYSQTLYRIVKRKGQIEKKLSTLCVFVPLLGEYGWEENES